MQNSEDMKMVDSWNMKKKLIGMHKFMTTLILYIPRNGTSIVIVHPSVKIVKKKPCLGKWLFAKMYKCWIESAINVRSKCTICMQWAQRKHGTMKPWLEALITLKASRFGDLTLAFRETSKSCHSCAIEIWAPCIRWYKWIKCFPKDFQKINLWSKLGKMVVAFMN